ncbi:MAG: GIY-YIG nuclease family protein [Bacteroidota bacterium]|nr:GIY-YIG nuclease family protein [Bacteroidota bacterium]MDX5506151.1 GIY-YIG nuclease family protein [Bacteroidota bacterium]
MYAVVDVETTGGYPQNHRVTEVGIVILDKDMRLVEEFHTLVNPSQPIPTHITTLTGISNEMVREAPSFSEISEIIRQLLSDRIFVAHNVHFDFGFIQEEFRRIGEDIHLKKLCTVRLSRKIFPQFERFSLKSLCVNLDIINENPHRALSDAQAAAMVLKRSMQQTSAEKVVQGMLNRQRGEIKLPMNVDPEEFHHLPNSPGVYLLQDEKGTPIYIGKAKNIKQRVATHFLGDGSTKRSQAFKREIHSIDFRKTGTEVMAMILEDHLIRKHWPRHNRAQKSISRRFGLVPYEDRAGNWRIAIKSIRIGEEARKTFFSYPAALNELYRICDDFGLDRDLCHLPALDQDSIDQKDHNQRIRDWIESENDKEEELYRLKGPMPDTEVVLLVRSGMPVGWKVVEGFEQFADIQDLIESLEPLSPSVTMARIWENHCEKGTPEPIFTMKT